MHHFSPNQKVDQCYTRHPKEKPTVTHKAKQRKETSFYCSIFFFFLHLSIPFHFKSNLRTNSIPPWSQFFLFPPPSRLVVGVASRPRTPRARNAHPTRRRRLTPPSPHPQYNHASIFSSSPSPPPHRHRRGPNSQPSKRPNPASPAAGDLRSGP